MFSSLLTALILGQAPTTERVTTTPGIPEAVMKKALDLAVSSLTPCVPELLPEEDPLDDRALITFHIGPGEKPLHELESQGLINRECVKKQSAEWKLPKPLSHDDVKIEWWLRVPLDVARARKIRKQALAELSDLCDVFKRVAGPTRGANDERVLSRVLAEFLRRRGAKVSGDTAADCAKADMKDARLTSFMREQVTVLFAAGSGQWAALLLETGSQLGQKSYCPELERWAYAGN